MKLAESDWLAVAENNLLPVTAFSRPAISDLIAALAFLHRDET
jgi:hypothetical protein